MRATNRLAGWPEGPLRYGVNWRQGVGWLLGYGCGDNAALPSCARGPLSESR